MPTKTLSWVSASVPAGNSLVEHITIPEGAEIEILKTKVTCSTILGTSKFFIFRKTTALDADRALATAEWPNSSPFVHPIEDDAGVTAERTLGYPLPYQDESATESVHRLHVKYTNNSSVAATYTCVVTYRTMASSIIVPAVLTNFLDRSLWLPTYAGIPADGNTAVSTFNSDGSVTFSSAIITLTASNLKWGITSRFRLFPDPNGELQYRLKFTGVTLPSTAIGLGDFAGLFSLLYGGVKFNASANIEGAGIMAQNGSTDLAIGQIVAPIASSGITCSMGTPSVSNITRPSEPFIVEIIVSIEKGTAYTVFRNVEYRFGATGSYTSVGTTNDQWDELIGLFGFFISIGMLRGRIDNTGSMAGTLTAFELLKGIAA